MFVRYFLELPLALPVVEDALFRDPAEWVPGLVEDAELRGRILLTEIGLTAGGRIQKRLVIELGEPLRSSTRSVLPMTWRAASQQSLFPRFDADLEVAEMGSYLTQFAISARYKPPLGAVGKAIDRALMHRVVEVMIKDFLDRAGEKILSLASESGSVGSVGASGSAGESGGALGTVKK